MAFLLLAAFLLRPCLWAQGGGNLAPSFPPGSIVNSASGSPTALTPNMLANLTGTNLSFDTASVSLSPGVPATLPTQLAGVSVIVGQIFAPILSVSPTQVNFLIPSVLVPGLTNVVLVRYNLQAQPAQITLLNAAPGLFVVDSILIAQHGDGSLITPESPANPGEGIVIYGTGLGPTNPKQLDGVVPKTAAPITLASQLQVLLDGQALPGSSIGYAGITPGAAGVYQVNFTVPMNLTDSPSLQVSIGDQMSQTGVQLPVAALPQPTPAAVTPCAP